MNSSSSTLTLSPWERFGRLWFQYRSYSPLPLFLLLFLLTPDFDPSFLSISLATIWIALSEALRIWAVGIVGSATRTRGDDVPQLIRSGPYRWTRNPLYIANIGLYTGCGFLFGFVSLSLVIFAYSFLQYSAIVAYEEAILLKTFGAPYERFVTEVPRWLGLTQVPRESSMHTFSLKRALKSEKSTLLAILTMGLLFAVKTLNAK